MMRQPQAQDCPPEQIAGLKREAEQWADRAGSFLKSWRQSSGAHGRGSLSAGTLLDLGAAITLIRWESMGLFVHREVGLPAAEDLLVDVFLDVAAPPGHVARDRGLLAGFVLGLFHERFAWSGQADLGVDLVLGPADEEAVLEALADFLWAHRNC